MPTYVGTSGWQYRHWRERYYPAGVSQSRWLERYAADFATVELNSSFYHLPKPATFAAWAERTPDDFLFAVKADRYLTHIRRLAEPVAVVDRLMEAVSRLGPKLAVVLVQLPPSMTADIGRLDETLAAFPPGVRVAVELRHASWFTEGTRDLLARHRAALCLTDRRYRRSPAWRTTDWTYLRLHEGLAAPRPCYGRTALRSWARRLAESWPEPADRFVYFNNDPAGCAVRDAALFAAACAGMNLRPTRTVAAGAVTVG